MAAFRFAPNTEWVCNGCGCYRLHNGYTPPPGWKENIVHDKGEAVKVEHRCAECLAKVGA